MQKERENSENKSYIRGNKLFVNYTPFTFIDLLKTETIKSEKINSAPLTPQLTKFGESKKINEKGEIQESVNDKSQNKFANR